MIPLPPKKKKSKKKVVIPPSLPTSPEPLPTPESATSPFDQTALYHLIAVGDALQVVQLHASTEEELEQKAREELKPLLSCSPLLIQVLVGQRLPVTRNTLQVPLPSGRVISLLDPTDLDVSSPEDGIVIGSVKEDSPELEQLTEDQSAEMLEGATDLIEPNWGDG